MGRAAGGQVAAGSGLRPQCACQIASGLCQDRHRIANARAIGLAVCRDRLWSSPGFVGIRRVAIDGGVRGAGIADEGHNGGTSTSSNGGGGGGAGAAGTTSGGAGLACDILNTTNTANASIGERSGGSTYFSGGGKSRNGSRGIGGTSTVNNSDASANSGGGASVSDQANNDNRGGSGVVVLRMPTSNYTGVTTGSPNVYTEGSDTILVYKGSGTYVD